MVDILVGPDKELFRVHKNLLCARMPVFDNMFNGGFKEAAEDRAKLPEDDPRTFEFVLEWLYTSQFRQIPYERIMLLAPLYCSLYAFAEKYCQSELMDFAMSSYLTFLQNHRRLPSVQDIEFTYEHTASGSPLRRLMVQSLSWVIVNKPNKGEWVSGSLCKVLHASKELLMDYLDYNRMRVAKEVVNPISWTDECYFHVHAKGEACSVKPAVPSTPTMLNYVW